MLLCVCGVVWRWNIHEGFVNCLCDLRVVKMKFGYERFGMGSSGGCLIVVRGKVEGNHDWNMVNIGSGYVYLS